MRGFSVGEWPYPVIALNGGDFPRGRSFTLLHELVHLSIRAGGLCDLHEAADGNPPGDELEHYCNQVAAAVLMPMDSLLADQRVGRAPSSHDWTLAELSVIAGRFQVSSEALLLRLITLGKADWSTYNRRRPEFQSEYESVLELRRLRRQQDMVGQTTTVPRRATSGTATPIRSWTRLATAPLVPGTSPTSLISSMANSVASRRSCGDAEASCPLFDRYQRLY